MKYLSSADIRERFLAFFEAKGCKILPSSSLVPEDPSLLLTSAGMVQFKPYFLQQKHLEAPYIGTTTVQKCVRTTDIDIIGTTGRHLSFFEMLGNFSFGAYFKREMCAWAYEFCTEVLELPEDKLYYTVYLDDDECYDLWASLGIDKTHISRLDADDNFWSAGPTGPCGPCSEIYFDRGPEFGCGKPDCKPGCDCDRYVEFWNLVFTQYDRQEDGELIPLPKKNIDTGMGLERIAAIMQGVATNYDTDLLRELIAVGERLSDKHYGDDPADDLSLRIMADHSRSVCFMIADGILPANEGRGYVLRRLLRRAVMKAHLLGIDGPFLGSFIETIVTLMGYAYPEIVENRELVERVVLSEEERFGSTLRQGQSYLDAALATLVGSTLDGEVAFVLHDTYGFPVEVTEEICATRGIAVDMDGFTQRMEEQKRRARAHAKDSDAAWSTYDGSMSALLELVGTTDFTGYDEESTEATVLALLKEGQPVDALEEGERGAAILDRSPFYAEMGGQVGDTGCLVSDAARARVEDTQAPEKGLHVHAIVVESGRLATGDTITASIDHLRRVRIRRNHTATHILHWALRHVLGEHVKQAGSFVGPDRLRFDFTHFEALSPDQLHQVEGLANQVIMENHPVSAWETSLAQARQSGVIALFGEKYGEVVRVLDVDGISRELCGGTHVPATGEIGLVKVTGESSVGANQRRIEAVTSFDALQYVNAYERELKQAAALLKVAPMDVSERTSSNLAQLKDLTRELRRNAGLAAAGDFSQRLMDQVMDVGYPLYIDRQDGLDAPGLRNSWDIIRARLAAPGACVLASDNKGTPIILAAGTDEAVAAGFDARVVIKAISGYIKGGGGGKPNLAQAGGKEVGGIDGALAAARSLFES